MRTHNALVCEYKLFYSLKFISKLSNNIYIINLLNFTLVIIIYQYYFIRIRSYSRFPHTTALRRILTVRTRSSIPNRRHVLLLPH